MTLPEVADELGERCKKSTEDNIRLIGSLDQGTALLTKELKDKGVDLSDPIVAHALGSFAICVLDRCQENLGDSGVVTPAMVYFQDDNGALTIIASVLGGIGGLANAIALRHGSDSAGITNEGSADV